MNGEQNCFSFSLAEEFKLQNSMPLYPNNPNNQITSLALSTPRVMTVLSVLFCMFDILYHFLNNALSLQLIDSV